MITLSKKERSTELNDLKRVLIDFKSLVDGDKFIIYKNNDLIFYIFDNNGFSKIIKTSDFLKIESFLDNDDFVSIKYSELKRIVDLKKSEITDIRYDTDEYLIETTISDEIETIGIKKHKDMDDFYKKVIDITSHDRISENFTEAEYKPIEQILISNSDNKVYPYKITFSDDINFKLKIDNSESRYYIRILNDGAFIQVITVSKYKEIYYAQTVLFVFNYLNNRGE